MDRLDAFRGPALAIVMMILAAVVIRAHAVARAQAPGSAGSPNVDNGKRLYRSVGCWECHGFEGQGSPAGARIGPPAIPLSAFLAYVRQPKGQMPPYSSKVMSDANLADIYAFLQSVPKPPPVKDIPLLNK